MPNVNIYIPNDLKKLLDAEDDLNVSAIAQDALRKIVEQRTNRCSRCGQDLPGKSMDRSGCVAGCDFPVTAYHSKHCKPRGGAKESIND